MKNKKGSICKKEKIITFYEPKLKGRKKISSRVYFQLKQEFDETCPNQNFQNVQLKVRLAQ